MKNTWKLLVVFFLWAETAHADSFSTVLSKMVEKYPYDFTRCEVQGGVATECLPPDGLEQVEVTSAINIQVILDVSGSMAGSINGQSKYQIATKALNEFVYSLPPHVNLAIRVYGHKGSNKEGDKALSCESSSLAYKFQAIDAEKAMEAVLALQPTGWTPLGLSLERALLDFKSYDPDTNNNVIYLLTDGIETCGGDPVAAASAIASADVAAVVNVIGFDLNSEHGAAIKSIAEAGRGNYFSASSLDELVAVFTSEISFRQWRQYLECSWKSANKHVNQIQDQELDRFNCVLDTADRITQSIQSDLIENHPDVEADVMLKIFSHQQKLVQPHYERYSSDAAFSAYMEKLEAIELLQKKLDELNVK